MFDEVFHSLEELERYFIQESRKERKSNRKQRLQETDLYHSAIGFPDWFSEELNQFNEQVRNMASSKKPFKASNTFKIQGGYPHEVEVVEKERLLSVGVRADRNLGRGRKTIPKLDIHRFITLSKSGNVVCFSTPKDTQFLRDIVLVDEEADSDFDVFYVVSRKARVVSAWSIKKQEGGFVTDLDAKKWRLYRQP